MSECECVGVNVIVSVSVYMCVLGCVLLSVLAC